ncbi:MAG TPA: 5-bromo-4-chloroindolyl phosphate hydrolysis family protein [Rhizomicrobium sp.]|nr:5-bromo-4-chloroindolyl phosphate hydrolysis family protein [Rhizomicrobium sp.]
MIACVAAAVVLPLLVLGLNLPLWLCGLIAAGVFVGLWYLLRAGSPVGIDGEKIVEARAETAYGLLSAADVSLNRLKKVVPLIQDAQMRGEAQNLCSTMDSVMAELRENPDRVMAIRRLFTFYLPNAVSVAEGWQVLERHADPSADRMQQTRETMQGLNDAFRKYAQDADAPDMQDLDITLKVLRSSLKADLEKTP